MRCRQCRQARLISINSFKTKPSDAQKVGQSITEKLVVPTFFVSGGAKHESNDLALHYAGLEVLLTPKGRYIFMDQKEHDRRALKCCCEPSPTSRLQDRYSTENMYFLSITIAKYCKNRIR
jgi:hypothetical protein